MLARLLDGDNVEGRAVEDRSPVPPYTAFVARPDTGVTVINADGFSAGRGALGDGPIATTKNAELAKRLVEMLNALDPALPKARRWWGQF
jgi:hypothetical protein